ncbi:MAG: hypothetical protein ACOYNY_25480 [Caldilineaceae bacterium]
MKKTLQSLYQHWENYRRVLQLVWGASPRYAFLATFFATLSALAAPAQIWLSKVIIDRIISAIQNRAPGAAIDWTTLVLPMGVLLLVLLCAEVGRRVAESITLVLRFQVDHYVQHLVLKKAAQFDIAFFESATFYDKLDLARRESYRTFNLALLATDSLGLLLSLLLTLSLVTQFHPLAAAVMVLLIISRGCWWGVMRSKRFASLAYNSHFLNDFSNFGKTTLPRPPGLSSSRSVRMFCC